MLRLFHIHSVVIIQCLVYKQLTTQISIGGAPVPVQHPIENYYFFVLDYCKSLLFHIRLNKIHKYQA